MMCYIHKHGSDFVSTSRSSSDNNVGRLVYGAGNNLQHCAHCIFKCNLLNKRLTCWWKFHWELIRRSKLKINQHWLKWCHGTKRQWHMTYRRIWYILHERFYWFVITLNTNNLPSVRNVWGSTTLTIYHIQSITWCCTWSCALFDFTFSFETT